MKIKIKKRNTNKTKRNNSEEREKPNNYFLKCLGDKK